MRYITNYHPDTLRTAVPFVPDPFTFTPSLPVQYAVQAGFALAGHVVGRTKAAQVKDRPVPARQAPPVESADDAPSPAAKAD